MYKIERIIIEGADQQGKTELCKKISSITGWKIIHFSPPKSNFNFHKDYLVDKYTISDRNFLSELVYSQIRGSKHRVKNLKLLQEKMIVNNYLVVLVDREEFYIHDEREEKFSREEIEIAIKLYRNIFFNLKMNKLIINPHIDQHLLINLFKNDNIQKTRI